MSCKLIFPQNHPGGFNRVPPKPLAPGPRARPGVPQGCPLLALAGPGHHRPTVGSVPNARPRPQEPPPAQAGLQKQRQRQGHSGLGLLLSRLRSTAHISAG